MCMRKMSDVHNPLNPPCHPADPELNIGIPPGELPDLDKPIGMSGMPNIPMLATP